MGIENGFLYRHQVLRINYTTYDMRREQDSINPRTHPDIMVLSCEDPEDGSSHPYWYARVIGVYHTCVTHTGPSSLQSNLPQRMDFLHIRWFGSELNYRSGWKSHRLHRICFVDDDDPGAYGFVDPSKVIRSVHLIPAFGCGRIVALGARLKVNGLPST